MQIEFELTDLPEQPTGYHPTAQTEGTLRIRLGGKTFLEAEGILLIELAVVADRWLQAFEKEPTDFYYVSMDFEEEPIFALRLDLDRQCFVPDSIWARSEPVLLTVDEAKSAFHDYLQRLRAALRFRCKLDLDEILARNSSSDS